MQRLIGSSSRFWIETTRGTISKRVGLIAFVKTTSRIDLPGHATTIRGLHQKVQGLAFAGTRGICLAEISVDGGAQWIGAALEPRLAPSAWVFRGDEWAVPVPGRCILAVRQTDGLGIVQTSIEQDPAPDGAIGLHEIL